MGPILSLALVAATLVAPPQDAGSVTEEWRGMGRVLDRALLPEDATGSDPRTVLLLLDATSSLAATGLPDALAAALERNAVALARTKVGVARVGADKPLLAPSEDPAAIVAAVRQALASPSERIQDVYAGLREACGVLAARAGEHAILLATLENGDAEGELEATALRLAATRTRVFVLAGEAYLADSYWAERSYQEHPRETQLTGGDSALIDLPWGWVFQLSVANELTPSGSAAYGLSRVAAASGGRVYLYAPANAGTHSCAIYATCLFCSGDHVALDEIYHKARLAPLLPSVAARSAVQDELEDDACFKAVGGAWRAALQAGLLRGQPPRPGRTSAVDATAAGRASMLLSNGLDRNADRAEAAIKDCERILAALEAELARADPARSQARQRANAEFTRVMLQLTKVNLVTYAGWCEEIAPFWLEKSEKGLEPPEVPVLRGERRDAQIGYSNRTLCHGVKPFLEVELPGGERLRKELVRLDGMVVSFLERYAHTPYAVALHRQGIAIFQQTFPGQLVERPRPKSKNAPETGPKSGADRPARAGPAGSGGSTGPTTGGGG